MRVYVYIIAYHPDMSYQSDITYLPDIASGRPDAHTMGQGEFYWWGRASVQADDRASKWVIGRFFVYVFFPSYYIEGNLPV